MNVIESLAGVICSVIKRHKTFLRDETVKVVYLAIMLISKKWSVDKRVSSPLHNQGNLHRMRTLGA